MINSEVTQHEHFIPFPDWRGDRIYMLPFNARKGLPKEASRWQGTVDAMLAGIDSSRTGEIYLMVDQAITERGIPHRRGGLHVDMCWLPWIHAHRPPGNGRHSMVPPETPRHGTWTPGHSLHGQDQVLMLASDTDGGSAFYHGHVDRCYIDAATGDCGNYSRSIYNQCNRVVSRANRVYSGKASSLIHESLPIADAGRRTVVRLNITVN